MPRLVAGAVPCLWITTVSHMAMMVALPDSAVINQRA
jgi:hypothetical protein